MASLTLRKATKTAAAAKLAKAAGKSVRKRVKAIARRAEERPGTFLGTGAGVLGGAAVAAFLRRRRRNRASARPPGAGDLNDPALARKVESEIFRDAEAPKGAVSVSVENGVVFLRGEVADSDQVEKLAAEARQVEGVREVQNLLHKPGEPAPAKSDGGPGSGAA